MPEQLLHYISTYGYAAIFMIIFLQEIGVPTIIPNEVSLVFFGYMANTGALNILPVMALAIAADMLGASILFLLFYHFGARLICSKPKWMRLPMAKINKLQHVLLTNGFSAILIPRLTPFIRAYTSIIAGTIKIKPAKYLLLALITAFLYTGGLVLAGFIFGDYSGKITPG